MKGDVPVYKNSSSLQFFSKYFFETYWVLYFQSFWLLPDSWCDYRPLPAHVNTCAATQSCSTFCNPMDCSPPGSSVHKIFQARILEWVAKGSSWPRVQTHVSCVSCIGRQILYHCATWEVPSFSQVLFIMLIFSGRIAEGSVCFQRLSAEFFVALLCTVSDILHVYWGTVDSVLHPVSHWVLASQIFSFIHLT